ncbi:MAG: phosphatase, partial [Lachnospira sp.]|nr:phosphatase [Lachnospira sp.]
MKYLIDTHTHTIASGHAYNTIDEMTRHAAELGVEYLGIT